MANLPPVLTIPAANLPPVANNGNNITCRYLKVNLKAKIVIYVKSTIIRGPNKIMKIFQIEDFFHLPSVSTTPVVNLELRCEYLREFSKKFETALMVYSGLGGN